MVMVRMIQQESATLLRASSAPATSRWLATDFAATATTLTVIPAIAVGKIPIHPVTRRVIAAPIRDPTAHRDTMMPNPASPESSWSRA
jgi:hypothetical protein